MKSWHIKAMAISSTHQERENNPAEHHDALFIGLYIRNVAANLFSFAAIVLLNAFTPLNFFKLRIDFFLFQGGWAIFLLFFALTSLLVLVAQHVVQRPISRHAAALKQDPEIDTALQDKACARLLNLPYIIALIDFSMFVLVPLTVITTLEFFRDIPFNMVLFLFFRTILLGLIAAWLSFFLIEGYARNRIVPLFFPKGRLTAVPGTIKLSILRRIRLLNMAGTLNPLLLLIVTIGFITWEAQEMEITAAVLSREILIFTLLLSAVFLAITLKLNGLVSNSIIQPIDNMLRVIKQVKGNDFTPRIRVISNDEIGILGDTGNTMIRGLADRKRIRETFGRYATPEIRDLILSGDIPVDGELRTATLLFSDLRGYTPYVEENPPEEVIRSTRDYFTAMQQAIRKHNGLVLQFVGDEIEAVFGVPIDHPEHADNALLAALEMRKRLDMLNEQRSGQGKPLFAHGIGICTGQVLAGITGSDNRQSYTLIGSTVNLASRIEQLTKKVGWDILVSGETVAGLTQAFPLKEEQPHPVKGYSKPVTVYRLL
jgi:class 3 adenylate cyclase